MNTPHYLNNVAVSHIIDMEYDEAIEKLSKALLSLRSLLSKGRDDIDKVDGGADDDLDSTANSNGSSSKKFSCDFVSLADSSSFLWTFEDNSSSNGINKISIFQDPIYVMSNTSRIGSGEPLSYVLLYNLAITNHLRAMKEQNELYRIECLNKALRLYEHAHRLLERYNLELPPLHMMAISSNLGHVHHILQDFEKSSLCFQHLVSLIFFLVDCGEVRNVKPLDGFFKNVMPLITKVPSAAAA